MVKKVEDMEFSFFQRRIGSIHVFMYKDYMLGMKSFHVHDFFSTIFSFENFAVFESRLFTILPGSNES